MSTKQVLFAGVFMLLAAQGAMAGAQVLCDARAAEVRGQMATAKAQGNARQVRGLERALSAIEENCTDEQVLGEAETQVRESLQEVTEREADLEEAVAGGDQDKVARRLAKLKETQEDLATHRRELEALREQLEAVQE